MPSCYGHALHLEDVFQIRNSSAIWCWIYILSFYSLNITDVGCLHPLDQTERGTGHTSINRCRLCLSDFLELNSMSILNLYILLLIFISRSNHTKYLYILSQYAVNITKLTFNWFNDQFLISFSHVYIRGGSWKNDTNATNVCFDFDETHKSVH